MLTITSWILDFYLIDETGTATVYFFEVYLLIWAAVQFYKYIIFI